MVGCFGDKLKMDWRLGGLDYPKRLSPPVTANLGPNLESPRRVVDYNDLLYNCSSEGNKGLVSRVTLDIIIPVFGRLELNAECMGDPVLRCCQIL